jgi:hypothetical protein
MLCSDAQCCYNSSYGYRLFPWDVVCCLMMHSVVITSPVVTDCSHGMSLCSDAQCCYNSSRGYRLFPCFVACCVAMHSVVITVLVVTDCFHVLSHVV